MGLRRYIVSKSSIPREDGIFIPAVFLVYISEESLPKNLVMVFPVSASACLIFRYIIVDMMSSRNFPSIVFLVHFGKGMRERYSLMSDKGRQMPIRRESFRSRPGSIRRHLQQYQTQRSSLRAFPCEIQRAGPKRNMAYDSVVISS